MSSSSGHLSWHWKKIQSPPKWIFYDCFIRRISNTCSRMMLGRLSGLYPCIAKTGIIAAYVLCGQWSCPGFNKDFQPLILYNLSFDRQQRTYSSHVQSYWKAYTMEGNVHIDRTKSKILSPAKGTDRRSHHQTCPFCRNFTMAWSQFGSHNI